MDLGGQPAVVAGRARAVMTANGESVLVLASREQDHTVNLVAGDRLDGWVVTESGTDFAVLVQDGEEVRLQLSDDSLR